MELNGFYPFYTFWPLKHGYSEHFEHVRKSVASTI